MNMLLIFSVENNDIPWYTQVSDKLKWVIPSSPYLSVRF